MREKILVVDDEVEITDLVALYLQNEGYEVYKAYRAADALTHIENTQLDLAVLDLMLPDGDGFSLCKIIRETHAYPIIMLTAKDEELDKITGLTLGADDYITKPFRPLELVARVKAQIRRYTRYNVGAPQREDVLLHKGLALNKTTHECTVNEAPVTLTPTEFSILSLLLEHKGQVFSAERIFCHVAEETYYTKSYNKTITVHIRHIREKLEDSVDNPQYIKTVWGVGYKIEK